MNLYTVFEYQTLLAKTGLSLTNPFRGTPELQKFLHRKPEAATILNSIRPDAKQNFGWSLEEGDPLFCFPILGVWNQEPSKTPFPKANQALAIVLQHCPHLNFD